MVSFANPSCSTKFVAHCRTPMMLLRRAVKARAGPSQALMVKGWLLKAEGWLHYGRMICCSGLW
jgi:hypothetical protein